MSPAANPGRVVTVACVILVLLTACSENYLKETDLVVLFLVCPFVMAAVMPVLVLAIHHKDTDFRVKFLFYAILAGLGLEVLFGPFLFLPIIFLPIALGLPDDTTTMVFAIAAPLVYLSLSFFISKALIRRFIISAASGSDPRSQPEVSQKKGADP